MLIDFWASWCALCRFTSPVVEKLAKKEGVVKFYKVNIDEVLGVPEELQIRSVSCIFVDFKTDYDFIS